MSSWRLPFRGGETRHSNRARWCGCLAGILGIAVLSPSAADPIGVLRESHLTTIGGAPASRGQTVFSGDRLSVGEGAAIITLAGGAAGDRRIVVRRDSELTLERGPDASTLVVLAHGDVSFSNSGADPEVRVRVGNLAIVPSAESRAAGSRSSGIVTLRDGVLQVASTEGSLRVEGLEEPVEVAVGKGLRAEFQSQAQPASNPPHNRNWGRIAMCSLAGGALGSIALIVEEKRATSPGAGTYTLIPAGIGAGALLCGAVILPAERCKISAEPPQITLGDPVTLKWSVPADFSASLTDLGAQASSGSMQMAPSQPGTTSWELTATNGADTLVCDARVAVAAAPDGCKLWYTTEDAKTFVLHWHLPKDAEDPMLTDDTPGSKDIWDLKDKGFDGTQEVMPGTGRQYTLRYHIGKRNIFCKVVVTLPSCHITVTKIDIRYRLQWDARYGTLTSEMPTPTPNGKKEVQAAYTVPTEDTTYTLSAKGSVYKDSSLKEAGGVMNLTSECSATISPVACKLTVDPQATTMPANVKVSWEAQNTKPPVTLQTVVNNRPVNTTANPMNPLTANVTQTTEFVLTITGKGGEKGSCKGCVLNRPAADKGKLLDIPPIYQGNRMWCWLTVAEMIFKYMKPPVPAFNPWKNQGVKPPVNLDPDKAYQWGILAVANPGCWERPDACADSGGSSWKHVQDTLKGYPPVAGQQSVGKGKPNSNKGVSSDLKMGCLSAAEVKAEIDAGRPILVGISPGKAIPPPVPDHVALIVGYQTQANGDIDLIVNDPWPYFATPNVPDPYVRAGGSKNCDGSYTVDRAKFCAMSSWNGSLINIQ
jgi:hypothetical protein